MDVPFLPSSGVVNHTLTLRHHRDNPNVEPFEPFAGHGVRMFAEKIEYWEDGKLKTQYNTPENPQDVSDFIWFPEVPELVDAAGKVTISMLVMTNCLESVEVVAYDYSVHKEPAEDVAPAFSVQHPDDQPGDNIKLAANTQSLDGRLNVVKWGNDLSIVNAKHCLIQAMDHVPIVMDADLPIGHNINDFEDKKRGQITWFNGRHTIDPEYGFEVHDGNGWVVELNRDTINIMIQTTKIPSYGDEKALAIRGWINLQRHMVQFMISHPKDSKRGSSMPPKPGNTGSPLILVGQGR
jgi:hypothetical protein